MSEEQKLPKGCLITPAACILALILLIFSVQISIPLYKLFFAMLVVITMASMILWVLAAVNLAYLFVRYILGRETNFSKTIEALLILSFIAIFFGGWNLPNQSPRHFSRVFWINGLVACAEGNFDSAKKNFMKSVELYPEGEFAEKSLTHIQKIKREGKNYRCREEK